MARTNRVNPWYCNYVDYLCCVGEIQNVQLSPYGGSCRNLPKLVEYFYLTHHLIGRIDHADNDL